MRLAPHRGWVPACGQAGQASVIRHL